MLPEYIESNYCYLKILLIPFIDEQEFINKGKYLDENKNRQSSLLLKEFYDVIEQSISIDKTTNATDELLMVDLLIKQMNDLERQYT